MIMSPWLKKHQWLFNDYIIKSKHLQVFQAQPLPHHPDMPSLVISSSSQGPVAFVICSSQLGVTFPSSSLTFFDLPSSVTYYLLCTPAAHAAIMVLYCDCQQTAVSSCGVNIQPPHSTWSSLPSLLSLPPTRLKRGDWPGLWQPCPYGHRWDFPKLGQT